MLNCSWYTHLVKRHTGSNSSVQIWDMPSPTILARFRWGSAPFDSASRGTRLLVWKSIYARRTNTHTWIYQRHYLPRTMYPPGLKGWAVVRVRYPVPAHCTQVIRVPLNKGPCPCPVQPPRLLSIHCSPAKPMSTPHAIHESYSICSGTYRQSLLAIWKIKFHLMVDSNLAFNSIPSKPPVSVNFQILSS